MLELEQLNGDELDDEHSAEDELDDGPEEDEGCDEDDWLDEDGDEKVGLDELLDPWLEKLDDDMCVALSDKWFKCGME